jgi:hypothetical protein
MQLGAFFHDYGALVAPVAAIINGFIAVVVAQFYKDHPFAKALLVVAAGVLGGAAIGATIFYQNLVISDREAATAMHDAEIAKRKAIREKLGSFIEEGNALKSQCTNLPPIWEQSSEWTVRVESFLNVELGHAYVIRDRDSSGVAPLSFSGDSDIQRLCYSIYVRVSRLGNSSNNSPNNVLPL